MSNLFTLSCRVSHVWNVVVFQCMTALVWLQVQFDTSVSTSLPIIGLERAMMMIILRKICISKGNSFYASFRLSKISNSQGRLSIEPCVRITARYFLSKVESSNEERRLCFVCIHKTHGSTHETETMYEYKEYNVDLCVVSCFVAYHTLSFSKEKLFF